MKKVKICVLAGFKIVVDLNQINEVGSGIRYQSFEKGQLLLSSRNGMGKMNLLGPSGWKYCRSLCKLRKKGKLSYERVCPYMYSKSKISKGHYDTSKNYLCGVLPYKQLEGIDKL
jgi:hypothetical protein